LNSNFVFFQWKSSELLSVEYVPPSYPKYRFQLSANRGAYKWKSNDSHLNLAWR